MIVAGIQAWPRSRGCLRALLVSLRRRRAGLGEIGGPLQLVATAALCRCSSPTS